MQGLPHTYTIGGKCQSDSNATIFGEGIPEIESAPPKQFGGPGDKWSPEDFLVAAVADCFLFSFKAIATASKFEWTQLEVSVDGILDRVERQNMFTKMTVKATLTIPASSDPEKAKAHLEKAEHICLITNSLKSEVHLDATVNVQ